METDTATLIKDMLDEYNSYAKVYRMARDRISHHDAREVGLQLIAKRGRDGRTYNLPTASEVAAIVEGDVDNLHVKRDILR